MLRSLRYNLARLARFSGRESTGLFWPYAGTVLILLIVGMAGIMLPLFADTFGRMQQFAAEHPDQATVTSGPGTYSISIQGNHPELFPDLSGFFSLMEIGIAIAVILLAAAVSRRLHDRGRSALWGILPLPFLSFSLVAMAKILASNPPDLRLFAAVFVNNIIYLASLLFLVIHLASGGTRGPNRYGDISDQ